MSITYQLFLGLLVWYRGHCGQKRNTSPSCFSTYTLHVTYNTSRTANSNFAEEGAKRHVRSRPSSSVSHSSCHSNHRFYIISFLSVDVSLSSFRWYPLSFGISPTTFARDEIALFVRYQKQGCSFHRLECLPSRSRELDCTITLLFHTTFLVLSKNIRTTTCTRSSLRLAHVLINSSTFTSFVGFQQQQKQSCRTVSRSFPLPRILVFRSLLLRFPQLPCSIRSTTHIRQVNHIRLKLEQVW